MNPRIVQGVEAIQHNRAPFNGAAGVNPRIDNRGRAMRKKTMAFNGAAGVNPRIDGLIRDGAARVASPFNGAAGVNPRIALAEFRDIQDLTLPSMGPRV